MTSAYVATRTTISSSLATLVGAACFFAWGFATFLGPAASGAHNPTAHIELAYFTSQAVLLAAVACALLISAHHPFSLPRWAVPAAGVGLCLLTLSLSLLSLWPTLPRAAMIALGAAIGVASPVLGVAWGARFSLEGKRTDVMVLVSFFAAVLIYFASFGVSYLFTGAGYALCALLPLASALLWHADARARHQAGGDVWPTKQAHTTFALPGELTAGDSAPSLLNWREILALAAAAIAGNMLPSIMFEVHFDTTTSICLHAFALAATLTIIAALWCQLSTKAQLSWRAAYRIMLPFTTLGLCWVLAFGETQALFASALTMGSGLFLMAFMYCHMARATQEHGFSPILSFGVGQSVVAISVLVGNLAGKGILALAPANPGQAIALCAAAAVLVIVAALLGLMAEAPASSPAANQPAPAPHAPQEGEALTEEQEATLHDEWAELEAAWAESLGLSAREAEVASHLVRGRSVPYIAETLFITAGTAKTHVLHIYRKAGVNSRQDLLDLYTAFTLKHC